MIHCILYDFSLYMQHMIALLILRYHVSLSSVFETPIYGKGKSAIHILLTWPTSTNSIHTTISYSMLVYYLLLLGVISKGGDITYSHNI